MFVEKPAPKFSDVTNWPVLVVALGLVLIEAGFLYAYRYGAKLGAFSFIGLAAASAVLLVAGQSCTASGSPGGSGSGSASASSACC